MGLHQSAILTTDDRGIIIDANEHFNVSFFNQNRKQVIGKGFFHFFG